MKSDLESKNGNEIFMKNKLLQHIVKLLVYQ